MMPGSSRASAFLRPSRPKGPIVMQLAISFVHLTPSILGVSSVTPTWAMRARTSSARGVSDPSSSPTANQVPLRGVFRWMKPGVKISAESSTQQPTTRSRPMTEAMVSLFMLFCTPTKTPSPLR